MSSDGMVNDGSWMLRFSFAEPAVVAILRCPPILGVPAALGEAVVVVLEPPQAAIAGASAAPAPTTPTPFSRSRRVKVLRMKLV